MPAHCLWGRRLVPAHFSWPDFCAVTAKLRRLSAAQFWLRLAACFFSSCSSRARTPNAAVNTGTVSKGIFTNERASCRLCTRMKKSLCVASFDLLCAANVERFSLLIFILTHKPFVVQLLPRGGKVAAEAIWTYWNIDALIPQLSPYTCIIHTDSVTNFLFVLQ